MTASDKATGNAAPQPTTVRSLGQSDRALYLIAMTAFLIIIAFGLRNFGTLLSSFFLALFIIIWVAPVRSWALRRGLPGWLASLLLFVTAVSVIAVVIVGVLFAVRQFVGYIGDANYTTSLSDLQKQLEGFLQPLGVTGADLNHALDSIDIGTIAGRLAGLLSGLLGIVGVITTVVITMVFLTMDTGKFSWIFNTELKHDRPNLEGALADFAVNIRKYFLVNSVFGLAVALCDFVVLLAFGIPLAFAWFLLSFLSSFIPNVGFVMGLIPPALLALALKGPWTAVIIVVLYVVINSISDNGIKPKVVGETVGLSATLTFFSLLFWAWIFGAIGALLAVPMTLFVKALLIDSDPNARWLRDLIALKAPDTVEELPDPPTPHEIKVADEGPAAAPS